MLVVEANKLNSVPCTAPQDLEVDVSDPISQMGHIHGGGFHVMFADGSVPLTS